LSEDVKSQPSCSILLTTTGLGRDDKDHVMRWINSLSWPLVDDFTSQGTA